MSRRWRGARPTRPRRFDPPWPQAPLSYLIPVLLRPAGPRRGVVPRHGVLLTVPPPAPSARAAIAPRRAPARPGRRGALLTIPLPAGTVWIPPTLTPHQARPARTVPHRSVLPITAALAAPVPAPVSGRAPRAARTTVHLRVLPVPPAPVILATWIPAPVGARPVRGARAAQRPRVLPLAPVHVVVATWVPAPVTSRRVPARTAAHRGVLAVPMPVALLAPPVLSPTRRGPRPTARTTRILSLAAPGAAAHLLLVTAVSLGSRWHADLVSTGRPRVISFDAQSLQYIPIEVTTSAGDPTGDVIQAAFVAPNTRPGPSDWQAAFWTGAVNPTLQPGTYMALCLIGVGASFTPAAGEYQVYIKITDSPEIPVLPAGTLVVF